MAKTGSRAINWSRLVIIGALAVLTAAVWAAQLRHSDSQTAAIAPVPGAAVGMAGTLPASPEAQTRANPQDPAGWRALGESQFQAGQFALGVSTYQHAVALAPGDATTWAALGEARVMASAHDPMPAEALKDFRAAAKIDPREPRARYFLAVERDLTGDHNGAITDWLALLSDTPPGAPWEADLRRTIEQVGRLHHIDVALRIAAIHQTAPAMPATIMPGVPAPSDQDLAAASSIPPSQQQAMATAMVARLEQRLAANPHNGEGWAMLIRSRMTLDGPEAASAVLARAVAADPADAAQLRQVAQGLGVK